MNFSSNFRFSASSEVKSLKKRLDFLNVAKNGKKKFTESFILQKLKRHSPNNLALKSNVTRIGLTVSRKVGKSVIRNKIKRRLRSISNEILINKGKRNYDYVIVANKKVLFLDYQELKKDLIKALK